MGVKVIDICSTLECLKSKPKWFQEVWRKPVVYHTDCLIDFKLVRDETRFAGGVAWFCKKCNKEVFCYEEYIEKFDYFAVFTLFCHTGCNAVWRMNEIEPYVESLFESPLFHRTDKLEWDLVRWAGTFAKLACVDEGY